MVLLRASSEAIGGGAELSGSIGKGDGGVPHGAALIRFAEAATRSDSDLEAARSELIDAAGTESFVEAAATVGIFNGLVRVADATGIPLDDGTRNSSVGFRAELGLNAFGSSRNTPLGAEESPAMDDSDPPSVARLFS